MIDRRAFLRRLGFGTVAAAAAASGVLDIERLLWVPGEKTIFIPPVLTPLKEALAVGDVFTIGGRYAISRATQLVMPYLQQFVVTEKVEAGAILMVKEIMPKIITDGEYRNVSGSRRERPYAINGRDVKPMWAR